MCWDSGQRNGSLGFFFKDEMFKLWETQTDLTALKKKKSIDSLIVRSSDGIEKAVGMQNQPLSWWEAT